MPTLLTKKVERQTTSGFSITKNKPVVVGLVPGSTDDTASALERQPHLSIRVARTKRTITVPLEKIISEALLNEALATAEENRRERKVRRAVRRGALA